MGQVIAVIDRYPSLFGEECLFWAKAYCMAQWLRPRLLVTPGIDLADEISDLRSRFPEEFEKGE